MNRIAMTNYILAWETENDGIEERLNAMTDAELKEHFELLYDAYQGMTPPPDLADLDPLNYNHIDI